MDARALRLTEKLKKAEADGREASEAVVALAQLLADRRLGLLHGGVARRLAHAEGYLERDLAEVEGDGTR